MFVDDLQSVVLQLKIKSIHFENYVVGLFRLPLLGVQFDINSSVFSPLDLSVKLCARQRRL